MGNQQVRAVSSNIPVTWHKICVMLLRQSRNMLLV